MHINQTLNRLGMQSPFPGVEGRFASRVAREEREGRELEREDSVRSTTSDSGAGSDYSEECEEGMRNEEGGEVRRKSSAVGRRRWSNIEGDEGRWAREEEGDRRLIQPDLCAISQLLNFDEVTEAPARGGMAGAPHPQCKEYAAH